jgi:hypothetical protein
MTCQDITKNPNFSIKSCDKLHPKVMILGCNLLDCLIKITMELPISNDLAIFEKMFLIQHVTKFVKFHFLLEIIFIAQYHDL